MLRQVFRHQTLDMAQILRGLIGAHHQRAGGRHITPFVEVPDDVQGAQPALAAQQPGLQSDQQAFNARHQCRAVDDKRVKFELFLELLRQHQPVVTIGCAAPCPVKRCQQIGTEAPCNAIAGKRQQIVPGAATGALQHAQVRARGAQRVHGQLTSAAVRGLAKPANCY